MNFFLKIPGHDGLHVQLWVRDGGEPVGVLLVQRELERDRAHLPPRHLHLLPGRPRRGIRGTFTNPGLIIQDVGRIRGLI